MWSTKSTYLLPFHEVFSDFFSTVNGTYLDRDEVIEITEKGLTISIDLPGVKRSDLDVQVVGQQLTVSGKARGNRTFKQSWAINREYDPTTVAAKLEDGVLTVSFEKREEAKSKAIKVEVK
jgi:HSP20 family protein